MDIPHSVYPSSVEGYLNCFYLLAIMNNAAIECLHTTFFVNYMF